MRTILLTAFAVLSVGVSVSAFADSARDVVNDDHQNVITNSFGNCVRTKWMSASDPCAPAKPAAVVQKVVETPPPPAPVIDREQRTVYFEFDKANLSDEGKGKLDALINTIANSKGIISADVVGYADKIGTASYNVKLSEKRAGVVKDYLDTKVRIPTSVAAVRGLGSLHNSECDSIKKRTDKIKCLAPDRRVEVEFKYQQK